MSSYKHTMPVHPTSQGIVPKRATVQHYGPNATQRHSAAAGGAKDEATTKAAGRARRSSVPPPASRDGSSSAAPQHQAAATSADAAALPSFPTLDKFLASKGQSLRDRRMQQINIEAAQAQAFAVQQAAAAAAAYPPSQQQYGSTNPYAYQTTYSYQHPPPHPACHPQPHAPPQLHHEAQHRNNHDDAQATLDGSPSASPSASPLGPRDPEPLSPASLREMLLLPELQAHLETLKAKWRREFEREQRGHHAPSTTKQKGASTEEASSPDVEHKSGPRVRFDDQSATKDAAALQHLQEQLLTEQQAHSSTMTRLTQLMSSRAEEQKAIEAERQQAALEREEMQHKLREAESRVETIQRAAEEEKQRHVAQVSTMQVSENILSSLTSKYEALLEKYTADKLAASELAATHRMDRAEADQTKRELAQCTHALTEARESLRATEDRLAAADRAHRSEIAAWQTKESQWLFARQDTFARIESDNESLRSSLMQAQREVATTKEHVSELESKLREAHSKLAESQQHAEARLSAEEQHKVDSLRFTEQMAQTVEKLNTELESKTRSCIQLESELRELLHAFEALKTKSSSKLTTLSEALTARSNEVDDCKTLLKTMMHEEKQARLAKSDALRKLQETEKQLAQTQLTLKKLQEEHKSSASDGAESGALQIKVESLQHELRIANELASRLMKEKDQLAIQLDDAEDRCHAMQKSHASELESARQSAAAESKQPDPELQRSLHDLQDQLSIKDKILDSLTDQLSQEQSSTQSLSADLAKLKRSLTEAERALSESDETRRSATRELSELRRESQEWSKVEQENEDLRRVLDQNQEELERTQKQLAKKQDSLAYIEGEVSEMQSLMARRESDASKLHSKEIADKNAEVDRMRAELTEVHVTVDRLTKQYQDAQNSVHATEQEMRVLVVELDRERRQRKQMKLQLQAMFPDL